MNTATFGYSSSQTAEIKSHLDQVLEQISASARTVGRDPAGIRLVVVTKGHPIETTVAAVQAGVRLLGENYVEEGREKIAALSGISGLEWHMIGHVQSRKADEVAFYFDWVHSVDSIKLAIRLNRFAIGQGKILPVLLECNVSGEETKAGWAAWDEADWDRLAQVIKPLLDLPNLQVRGLMTMAPFSETPEQSRPFFKRLRQLRDRLAAQYPDVDWSELSMGMSGDFRIGVEEGATLVRVGTAILGSRRGS